MNRYLASNTVLLQETARYQFLVTGCMLTPKSGKHWLLVVSFEMCRILHKEKRTSFWRIIFVT